MQAVVMAVALQIVLVLVVLLAALFIRRSLSTGRGARKRDMQVLERLEPLRQKVEHGQALDRKEITRLAGAAELRRPLYRLLSSHGCKELFPAEYLTREAEAAALLTHWMLHPNELRAAPEIMQPVAKLQRRLGRKRGEFIVFRYRMPSGHWAGDDWMLGIAGPFFEGEEPYDSVAGAFSRCTDIYGQISAATLVDRYVRMIQHNFRAAS